VGGTLLAGGLNLNSLLSDAAGITRLEGIADAELSFLGVGASVQAIMDSLKGEAAIRTGRGVINGVDLDQLMRSGQGAGGTTVFDSLTASFDIAGGVAANSDLLMTLPRARATGAGRIGLGAQTIDYLFTPVALEARGGKGLAIPVRIRGPWADPRITADLEQAINLNLAEEKEALQQEAKDKLSQKVEEKLGVEVQEGQSLEDAIEQKLKEEAAKGLLKLFE